MRQDQSQTILWRGPNDSRMPVVIWRDSVAMGDDTHAPHELVLPVGMRPQVDPDRVYECLRTGAPLPDRYSG